MKSICRLNVVTLLAIVFILAISPPLMAEKCSDLCDGLGLGVSWVDGTAPFCSGDCLTSVDMSGAPQLVHVYSSDVITCAGKCTDGSSCLSGSKQCSCAEKIDCSSACGDAGAGKGSLLDATCAVGTFAYACDNCTHATIGWCDSSNACHCSWNKL